MFVDSMLTVHLGEHGRCGSLSCAQDHGRFSSTSQSTATFFNHKQASEDWAKKPTCPCDILRRCAPEADKFGDHFAALRSQVSVGFKTVEKRLLAGTMGNMLFPGRQEMLKELTWEIHRWSRENQLPTDLTGIPEIFEFLLEQHNAAAGARSQHSQFH